MAYHDTMTPAQVLSNEITATRNFIAKIGTFFSGFGESVSLAAEARYRHATVVELNAKSDAELARLNLKREDIVRHVFKDLYYS